MSCARISLGRPKPGRMPGRGGSRGTQRFGQRPGRDEVDSEAMRLTRKSRARRTYGEGIVGKESRGSERGVVRG